MLAALNASAPDRLRWTASDEDLPELAAARLEVAFDWRDAFGSEAAGAARVWLPASLDGRAPLIVAAGYELAASQAIPWLASGFSVATLLTPEAGAVQPGANPISRGINMDVSFLHAIRLASFVDDAKVFVAGGSAGGYMALMLAAETFPLAGAIADVPVVNLGYNVAFWRDNHPMSSAPTLDGQPTMPYLASLVTLANEAVALYGDDVNDEVFFTHSPVGHTDRVTCPVSACFSTGDNLVPIEQVDEGLARPLTLGITTGMVMSADDLCAPGPGRTRLLEAVDPALVEVSTVPVPPGTERRRMEDPESEGQALVLSLPAGPRRWNVAILDEGGPDEDVPHFRFNIRSDHEAFWHLQLASPTAVDQLDETKLALLLDRWNGREWMAGGPPQLDAPDAERRDVERGLRTFCATSPEHRRRFSELYSALPSDQRTLDPALVSALALAHRGQVR